VTVRKSVQDCFRELAISMPYETISVTLLCKRANVSRTAFYDAYVNKEAVLSSIVEDDIVRSQHLLHQMIPVIKRDSSPQIMAELIYQNIRENAHFYLRINKAEKGALLIRAITERLIIWNNVVLKDFDLPDDEKHYTALFFSVANATLISKWLENNMDMEPARLAYLFNKWTLNYWQKASPVKQGWLAVDKV
jgi:AcrR family transcriptional regulator